MTTDEEKSTDLILDQDQSFNQWIHQQLHAEIERIEKAGVKPIPLNVTRVSLEIDWTRPTLPVAANRLEVCTNFPFDNVKQILVSSPIHCPMKSDFEYVHLVLFTDKTIPMIMPYVYRSKYRASPPQDTAFAQKPQTNRKILVRNKLNTWIFINKLGQVSHHKIDQFDEI